MSKYISIELLTGKIIVRNTVLNSLGQATPLISALVAVPVLISNLSTARFGILSLAWAIMGYFSIFDFGLGRALTKVVAEKIGEGDIRDIPVFVWTSQFLMMVLGLVGTFAIIMLSPWLVLNILNIPKELQPETLNAFYLIALSVPFTILSTGFQGTLEAQQRFGLVNAIRIPLGMFTFLGPLLVLPFSKSVFSIVAILALSRFIFLLAYLLSCISAMPALRHTIKIERRVIAMLLRYGGWMSISNIIGPLMVYWDRFFIGALISVTAVAYYITPYEVVTKLRFLPMSLIGVLFPAFSTSFARQPTRTATLYVRGTKYIFLILFPIVFLLIALAKEGLTRWLGNDFAQESTVVLQLLAIGFFMNSLAYFPFALIQSIGRPDITAKIHLAELPIYLIMLMGLIILFGIEGAAIAWTIRAFADCLTLFAFAQRLYPIQKAKICRAVIIVIFALFMFGLATISLHPIGKSLFIISVIFGFLITSWFLVLEPNERLRMDNFFDIVDVLRR